MHPDVLFFQNSRYIESLPSSMLVPHYLLHCACYYVYSSSIIQDHEFDQLAQRLKREWKKAKHVHRDLIDPEGLSAGGSHIKLPLRVLATAAHLLEVPVIQNGKRSSSSSSKRSKVSKASARRR
jgi:hypothetical protein